MEIEWIEVYTDPLEGAVYLPVDLTKLEPEKNYRLVVDMPRDRTKWRAYLKEAKD